MVITFKTETGSTYTVDTEAKTWKRPFNPASPYVRTTEGDYHTVSDIVVGERVHFLCPPLDGGPIKFGNARFLSTTRVVSIEEAA